MLAEKLLSELQQTLQAHAPRAVAKTSSSETLRTMENQYGATATASGRRLRDLLHGSAAWELFERPLPGASRGRLPRAPDLSRCESVIEVMRESGELAEREHLLDMRDTRLRRDGAALTAEPARSQSLRATYDDYFEAVAALLRQYRPLYQEMRRQVGSIPPLPGPRVRSRPLLQPPLMSHLFQACHSPAESAELASAEECQASQRLILCDHRSRRNAVRIVVHRDKEEDALPLLDERTWDVAAIAVSAFFVRTSGSDPDASFPLLIDDYFDWRGVDPRKRTPELRREIDARIRLLCDPARLHFDLSTELYLPDAITGRRAAVSLSTEGSFLVRRSGLYRPAPWRSEMENEPVFGHLVTLGTWARPFLNARTMIGAFPRRLAEYDMGRQQWERRIGWYLTFQMQNQGSRMTLPKADTNTSDDPAQRTPVIPQHALRMRTVLEGSRASWQEMARTNPGKVIRQWMVTLQSLRADGIIGDYSCLDGSADGADLPVRHRLSAMLERRYQFTPGEELAQRLRRKAERQT